MEKKSDPGPLAVAVIDSGSSDDVLEEYADESIYDIPVADSSSWMVLSKNFTTDSEVTDPQISSFCSTPLQFCQLFFIDQQINMLLIFYLQKIFLNLLFRKHGRM